MMKVMDKYKVSSLEGLPMFNLDFASKGLSWGENICQKLDNAIQDNIIVQNPSMFIDALGDRIWKMCAGVTDDWLNPFSDGSIKDRNPDLIKDVKSDVHEKSMKTLDEQLIEEKTGSHTGLNTSKSSEHHTLSSLLSMPQDASFEEATAAVCRSAISSPLEHTQHNFSSVTGQSNILSSSLSIPQHNSLKEASDELCKISVSSPVEPTQYKLSSVIGHDSSLSLSLSMPQDVSVEEVPAKLCRSSISSSDEPTQHEFSTVKEVLDVENPEHVVSRANNNLFTVVQHMPALNENEVVEQGKMLLAGASSGELHESSDSMISGDMTDLNTEAMTTVEFEDVELEDVNLDEDSWDDSVLDEILLISQHASKKFFHKKKLGTLAAIASRFCSAKKKDHDQITTWIGGTCRRLERNNGVDGTASVLSKELNHNSSLASNETCESDWELV